MFRVVLHVGVPVLCTTMDEDILDLRIPWGIISHSQSIPHGVLTAISGTSLALKSN
ncbi:hypothetical protein PC110_g4367 [Phytophthora cactorum]|uniref:Uncharacterized protein n=1 Tax=Phytophthora cactorum TaxID=29920 RepID=A0A329SRI0_9STRA|nr:hypothetical protein PC111_g6210 [Phytophthora cactorum]KAG2916352.1 hypothetical protein PC114_g7524 [Phytophthora cactorum]KAG2946588.1 hypothetical protein PC117_g7503 [Phytophthora cactorum]KAG3034260.1 hypothetical protein PC119_g4943 [Phytophthora cactorum]RAW39417.1 hypothetical protein PC110_g4367 [Phytophthora cactorum]